MAYGCKYFANEVRIIKVDCGNGCRCDKNSCKNDLELAKSKVIKYYVKRVQQVCDMSLEDFEREFLLETRNVYTDSSTNQ